MGNGGYVDTVANASIILSGNIGSGTVYRFSLASGAVNSGHVASGAVLGRAAGGAFCIASGSIGHFDIAGSGIILSGQIGSGSITGQGATGAFCIASGSIFWPDLAQQSVFGSFAGAIATIQSGSLGALDHASGCILSGHIGSGAVLGQQGGGAFNIASGTIGTYDFASGAVVNHAQELLPFSANGMNFAITEEIISGCRAVTISPSGNIRIAMAAVSGRMPAVGVVHDNTLSGIRVNLHIGGFFQNSSGMNDYSGYLGKRVFVGRSGEIVVLSGSWNSGGYASGDLGQSLGMVMNSGAILFNIQGIVWSGGPLGLPAGWVI